MPIDAFALKLSVAVLVFATGLKAPPDEVTWLWRRPLLLMKLVNFGDEPQFATSRVVATLLLAILAVPAWLRAVGSERFAADTQLPPAAIALLPAKTFLLPLTACSRPLSCRSRRSSGVSQRPARLRQPAALPATRPARRDSGRTSVRSRNCTARSARPRRPAP